MVPLLLLLLLLQSTLLQPSSRLCYHQLSLFPLPVSLCPPSPGTYYLFSGGHHDMCVYKASSGTNICVQIFARMWMILMLQQPQDRLQQPQRKMLQLVVLMLLPVPRLLLIQSACTALNCLPSPFFLSYLLPFSPLSSLCLHRPVTQSCIQHGGDPAAELPLFICQMSPFFPLLCLFLQVSPLQDAFFSQQLLLRLA